VQVYLPKGQTGGELPAFTDDGSVFCNKIVTAKDKVLCGLSRSRVGVDVAANAPCGLTFDKLFAVLAFSDNFV
jgi:hypothetical protein